MSIAEQRSAPIGTERISKGMAPKRLARTRNAKALIRWQRNGFARKRGALHHDAQQRIGTDWFSDEPPRNGRDKQGKN